MFHFGEDADFWFHLVKIVNIFLKNFSSDKKSILYPIEMCNTELERIHRNL